MNRGQSRVGFDLVENHMIDGGSFQLCADLLQQTRIDDPFVCHHKYFFAVEGSDFVRQSINGIDPEYDSGRALKFEQRR